MERKSFVLYTESKEIIEKLSREERGDLLEAVFKYASGESINELNPITDIVFSVIKNYMDKDFAKYEEKCSKNRKNIEKRWSKGNSPEEEKEDVKKRQNRFKPPTLKEVQQYIESESFKVDAEKFLKYYEANDWHDSKGAKVKSWKQKLVTWNKKETNEKSGSSSHPNKFNSFEQQSYDMEAIERSLGL